MEHMGHHQMGFSNVVLQLTSGHNTKLVLQPTGQDLGVQPHMRLKPDSTARQSLAPLQIKRNQVSPTPDTNGHWEAQDLYFCVIGKTKITQGGMHL